MKIDQHKLVENRKNNYQFLGEKIDHKIQESIFGVLYVLLKDDESSVYTFLFLSFTEFLEFLQFPFSSALMIYWGNHPIAEGVQTGIGYINIVNYLSNSSAIVYLTIYYMFVLSVTLVIVNIAYVSYSFSRKYFTHTWPLYVLSKVAKTFVTILFMPIFELFLSMFTCNLNDYGYYINNISPELICFESFHYLHMVISFIVSILFLIICMTVAINFFECSEISNDVEAK